MVKFRMKISQIFWLPGLKKTMLVGLIDVPDRIGAGCYDLVFKGVIQKKIYCEGEQLIKRVNTDNQLRSIATNEVLEVPEREGFLSGDWELVLL